MQNTIDVLIVGGGLSGLALAYLLDKEDIRTTIIEGRERLGGRIHTLRNDHEATLEMGATWFGKKHVAVVSMLKELNLHSFKQKNDRRVIFEPEASNGYQMVEVPREEAPSFRVAGGTYRLIEQLQTKNNSTLIELNQVVKSVDVTPAGFKVTTYHKEYHSHFLVSTIPLHLFAKTINLQPALPTGLNALLFNTHTWMGESIKFGLTFASPFWREKLGTSTVFSHQGPIIEMYEHNDAEDSLFAIKGFLHPRLTNSSYYERKEAVINQLTRFYGTLPSAYLSYEDKVWSQDPMTYSDREVPVIPHQNNGHHEFRQPLFDGKFFFGGTETAARFPGYMDGAIERAYDVSKAIINEKRGKLVKSKAL